MEEEKDGKVRSKEAKGSEHTHTHTYAGNVREQTPQSSEADGVDGVSSLVEMVSDRFVPVVFYVS